MGSLMVPLHITKLVFGYEIEWDGIVPSKFCGMEPSHLVFG